ncbi:YlxR family protein [Metamycoplasma canadense]|uniref:YlxR family protein n=1 Tax=Metamycoplasma canadense TaxID=29554 RepID=UPI0005ED9215|nr:YlxR family protein [Metamycoplasma canadense]
MKIDKKYSRKSVVDGKIYPISQLIRFAKVDNNFYFDPNLELKGRGAYCLNNLEQINTFFKKHLLNKAFKQNINQEIHTKLRNEVEIWLNKRTTKELPM